MVVDDNALSRQIETLGESQLRDMLNYLVLLNSEAVHNALLYVQRGGGDGGANLTIPVVMKRRPGGDDDTATPPPSSRGNSARSTRSLFTESSSRSSSRTLVVLCTYTPTSKRQLKNQDRAMELCKRQAIRPEIVLGTDPVEVEKCHRLFQISGLKDSYPQFFLKESDGNVRFLGDLHTVETMMDEGTFTTEHLKVEEARSKSRSKKKASKSNNARESSNDTIPDHLMGMNQPVTVVSDDELSLASRDVFEFQQEKAAASLLEAARRAKDQMDHEQGATPSNTPAEPATSTIPEFLARMNQPKEQTEDDDTSLGEVDIFDPPSQPMTLLLAARKAKEAMDSGNPAPATPATRPVSESTLSPQPPPPKSHRTPESPHKEPKLPETWGRMPSVDNDDVPSWVKKAASSTKMEPSYLANDAPTMQHAQTQKQTQEAGPAWMQNVQTQQPRQAVSSSGVENVQQMQPLPGGPAWVENAQTRQAPQTFNNSGIQSNQQSQPPQSEPAWMQSAQPQPMETLGNSSLEGAQQTQPPPSSASAHDESKNVGDFHSSAETDLGVITEGDEAESPLQDDEQRKSATDRFPTGGACYLVYHPVEGELNIHYSEFPIDGAVGVWTSPDIEMFKEAQGLGSSELIGNCASNVHDRKNYYSGWCQFVKAGKSMDATITVLDVGLPVDFYMYQGGSSRKCGTSFTTTDLDAVACVPKYHDFNTSLEGKKWAKEAKKVGAVAQFRSLSSRPKGSPSGPVPEQEPLAAAPSPSAESEPQPQQAPAATAPSPPVESGNHPTVAAESVSSSPANMHSLELSNSRQEPDTPAVPIAVPEHSEQNTSAMEIPAPPRTPRNSVIMDEKLRPKTPRNSIIMQPIPPSVPQPSESEASSSPTSVKVSTVAVPAQASPASPPQEDPTSPFVDPANGACYLIYEPESSGRLVLHYSKSPISNAIGMWVPGEGKSISGFKFKQNLGKSVLIGNCASGVQGRKNYCSGWCQFVRAAKILNGSVTLWDPTTKGLKVDVWLYTNDSRAGHQSIKLEQGEPFGVQNILGVACIPKHTDFYGGLVVDILKWLADSSHIGASSRF